MFSVDVKLIERTCMLEKNLVFGVHRGYAFRAQTQEMKERGGNQSIGIDFFITQERIIFLDTQVGNQNSASTVELWSMKQSYQLCNKTTQN